MENTAAGYGIEIGSDKSKILVNGIKPRPSANVLMNRKVFEAVDQFRCLGSTQIKDLASLKEAKIRLVQAHSAMTWLAVLWKKTKSSVFLPRLNFKSLI